MKKNKIGQNDLSWCGSGKKSGKKYKRCHLNTDKEKLIKPYEIENQLKKSFSKKYCSVPNDLKQSCKGSIIRAHTVSKKFLKIIEKDGQVYGFSKFTFFDMVNSKGVIEPKLIGVNQASTFTGFCKKHDKELFSAIEDGTISLNKKTVFFLGYRTVARESFLKNCQYDHCVRMKKLAQRIAKKYELGVKLSKRGVDFHKEKFDQLLINKNFDEMHGYCIVFNEVIPLLCSSAIFFEIDFKGNLWLNLCFPDKSIPSIICFNSFIDKKKSYFLFSWNNYSNRIARKFIELIDDLSEPDLTAFLIKFQFSFCENIYFNPSWFNGLHDKQKKYLIDLFNNILYPLYINRKNMLWNDHVLSEEVWNVIEKVWI